MKEKKNMLNVRTIKVLFAQIELIMECLLLSLTTAAGTVGVVLILAGISVEDFGMGAYTRFSLVATAVFFTIFMGNYLDKRGRRN